jgi:hypothetical protein
LLAAQYLSRWALQRRGCLNQKIINESDGMPVASTFVKHFGSLTRAYDLIGFTETPAKEEMDLTRARAALRS